MLEKNFIIDSWGEVYQVPPGAYKSPSNGVPHKGAFTFYVDKIWGFFDPFLPLRRQFIY